MRGRRDQREPQFIQLCAEGHVLDVETGHQGKPGLLPGSRGFLRTLEFKLCMTAAEYLAALKDFAESMPEFPEMMACYDNIKAQFDAAGGFPAGTRVYADAAMESPDPQHTIDPPAHHGVVR